MISFFLRSMNVHFDGERAALDLDAPHYAHTHVILVYRQTSKIDAHKVERQSACDPSLLFGDRSRNVGDEAKNLHLIFPSFVGRTFALRISRPDTAWKAPWPPRPRACRKAGPAGIASSVAIPSAWARNFQFPSRASTTERSAERRPARVTLTIFNPACTYEAVHIRTVQCPVLKGSSFLLGSVRDRLRSRSGCKQHILFSFPELFEELIRLVLGDSELGYYLSLLS